MLLSRISKNLGRKDRTSWKPAYGVECPRAFIIYNYQFEVQKSAVNYNRLHWVTDLDMGYPSHKAQN